MSIPDPSSLLPPVRPDVFSTSLALCQDDVDWLDSQAALLNRSRSDVAREIFRNIREQQAPRSAAT